MWMGPQEGWGAQTGIAPAPPAAPTSLPYKASLPETILMIVLDTEKVCFINVLQRLKDASL